MPRTICDLGDAHIRLQAPDHWMQVEARGSRVILSDAGCSTPIFLEPLPTVEAVDTWIAALVTRKSRLHGHQECSKPDARRFVLTITSREGTVERAYQLQRVPSSRSMLVWVAASIDLDGEASRAQLLAQVFPGVKQVSNVANDSGLRQYIEAEGFTLKLPRTHSVAEAAELRFQLREGEALFGWLRCGRIAADAATATETIDELQQRRGAIAQRMSETSRLVMVPAQGDEVHDCMLWVEAGERGHLVFSLEKSGRRDLMVDFFRRLVRGLRPWAADFHGYWTAPHSLAWRDFKPAPAPAPVPPPAPSPPPRAVAPPPPPDLRTEWKERLSGAVLRYKSSPSGSQPRGFYGGGREVTIYLHPDGTAAWEESGFVSTTLPGMYMGGPYTKRQSGTWILQALDTSAWLVLHLSEDGRQRLPLGRSGNKVTLDGMPYSMIKV
jgi:hypothetical protein